MAAWPEAIAALQLDSAIQPGTFAASDLGVTGDGDARAGRVLAAQGQLVLCVMPGFEGHEELLAKLGRHRIGKSCLYIRHLADVDAGVLGRIIDGAVLGDAAPLSALKAPGR